MGNISQTADQGNQKSPTQGRPHDYISNCFRGECLLELSHTLLITYINETFIILLKCLYFISLALVNYDGATIHKYFDGLSTSWWVRGDRKIWQNVSICIFESTVMDICAPLR